MSTIELNELGPPLELSLTAEEGRALAFSGVVSAVPSPYRPGIWLVGAAGKVGAARIGPAEVFIRPNPDLYQLLAYCTILGLPVGHLVYARGNASPARHVVRQSGVEILCHAVDLSQPPDQLIRQMSNLAELVSSTAVTSCRYPA